MGVQCPRCSAPAGEQCFRNQRFGGGKERRSSPHRERRALARQRTGTDFGTPAKTIDLMQALKASLEGPSDLGTGAANPDAIVVPQ